MEIKVWICPTEGCGNYYGSRATEDQKWDRIVGQRGINGEVFGHERHRGRNACPDCFSNVHQIFDRMGVCVERVLTVIEVPLDDIRSVAPTDDAVTTA